MENVVFEFAPMAMTAGIAVGTIILKVALTLLGGYFCIRVATKLVKKFLEKTALDVSLHTFILNSLKAALWIMLIVTVFGVLGIPTSTFVAVLGAGGAAIALALKDSLGNIAGGIIILVTKPFKQGDFIDITEIAGVVEHIDLLYTTLKTTDNKVVRVPNGKLTTAVMVNYSTEDTRRVDCKFGIGYDDDITKAKDVLLAVAESNPDIFAEPAPFVGVAGHGDSAVEIDMRVWCSTEHYWDVKYFLEENVKLAFDEAGISIPYPQLDVHNKK